VKRKILFRADGNSKIGLGHLYRVFALIEIINEEFEYIFLTKENSTFSVIPKGYNTKIIPEKITISEEPKWIFKNYNPSNYAIIFDGYQFDTNYQKSLKLLGFSLIYIDDSAKHYMYADLVINHSPQVKEEHFKSESYTSYSLGMDYVILRPLFLEQAKKTRLIKPRGKAFISFGGADPFDITLKSIKSIKEIDQIKEINVVLGSAYNHDEIFNLKKYSHKINIYQNISEKQLLEVMLKCDMAIAPSSTILYELMALEIPTISGYFVENQKESYLFHMRNQNVFGIGNFIDMDILNFKNEVLAFMKSNFKTKKIIDGKSNFRIINKLKKHLL